MAEHAAQRSGWTPERSAAGDRSPWILTGIISIATFMTVLDSTIVNVSLPHIAGNLGTSVRESTWVLTSFLIATAIVIPISGWLSDVVGRKRYYMISVALFTGASVACALSPNIEVLIFFRIIQGIGGGGLAPSEQSMLADSFPPEKRGMAFAAYAVVVVVGPILGPVVGGYITDATSWHWIFLVNLPFGALSIFLVGLFVVEPEVIERERQERWRQGLSVDLIGLALVAIGLGSLTYVLAEGQSDNWFASQTIVIGSILAVTSLAALVWWELRHPDPIVPIRLLGNRQFAIVVFIMFLVGVILFGTTQIIPQMYQEIFHYTAFRAGLALTLGGVGIIMVMPLAGRLAGNVDPRLMLIPGFLALAFGLHHFTTLTPQATFWDLSFARLLQTFALPFVFVTVNTIAYLDIPADKSNDASALLNVFRSVGGSVGISFSQTILARNGQTHQSNLTEQLNQLNPNLLDLLDRARSVGLSEDGTLGAVYAEVVRQAHFLAYLDVYRIVTFGILAVVPLCLLLHGEKNTADKASAPVPA